MTSGCIDIGIINHRLWQGLNSFETKNQIRRVNSLQKIKTDFSCTNCILVTYNTKNTHFMLRSFRVLSNE